MSIYLGNALYNNDKPSVPTSPTMQLSNATPAGGEQSTVTISQPATATKSSHPAKQAQQQQDQQQSEKGDHAMHPARQLQVNYLGPLEVKPEPMAYKISGANTQPVGQKVPHVPKPRGRGAVKWQTPSVPVPTASENLGAARERSTVAACATAAARLGQPLQPLGANRTVAGRDPRLRNQAEEGQEAPSSSDPVGASHFGGSKVKKEEVPWEAFSEHLEPKLPEPGTDTTHALRAESLPFHPMLARDQLHRPVGAPAVCIDVAAAAIQRVDFDPVSDSEIRIRELEDENLGLRKEGFSKDREIRKLRAELLRKAIHTGFTADAGFEAGMKRPRYDNDVCMVNGPVRDQ